MSDLLDIRHAEGYQYEILIQIDEPGGETWVPLATEIIRRRHLAHPDGKIIAPVTIEEALIAEGWIPPGTDLEPLLCLTPSFGSWRHNAICTQRKGHEGYHSMGGFRWEAA